MEFALWENFKIISREVVESNIYFFSDICQEFNFPFPYMFLFLFICSFIIIIIYIIIINNIAITVIIIVFILFIHLFIWMITVLRDISVSFSCYLGTFQN